MLSPILVGRDGHLELAEARLADARAGHGRTLLIAGEAGIGKTRLLGAILRSASASGFDTVKGDVGPQDRDVPGALLLDAARTMREVPSMAEGGEAILRRWGEATDGGRAVSRKLVLDVVERLRGSAVRPTVYAFEDLQWADDLSLDVIAELARTIDGRRIAVLATHRRDDTPTDAPLRAWRARLLTQRWAEEVRLDRLTQAQTATVISLLLQTGMPAPTAVVEVIHERSDGVPLHIEEIVAAVSDHRPVDVAAVRRAEIPDTIEDAVLARTARLSPAAQAVARAGAVLGRCFVPDVLAGVMDVPAAELEDPLEELVEHAILYPFGTKDVGYHDFRHQLLREALYRHTPARERRRYHARAAEFGATLPGATAVHASLHYAQAGLRDEAYRAALSGAESALRVKAHREAYELYRRALDHRPDDLDLVALGRLIEAVALEALALEDVDVAVDSAWEAAAAYREAGAIAKAISATSLVLVAWRRDGEAVSTRLELIRRLFAELDEVTDEDTTELRADLYYYLGYCLVDDYQLVEAREAAKGLRAAALAMGSDENRLAAEELQALIDIVEIGPAPALARMEAAAQESLDADHEVSSLSGFRDGTIIAARAYDYASARRLIETGIRYGAEVEQSHCGHVMAGVSTVVSWAVGDWDEAVDTARQVVADRGCRRGAAAARWALGYVATGRGDAVAAETELRGALEFGQRSESLDLILPPLWGLAELALTLDPATSVIHCDTALARAGAVGERLLLIPFVVTGARAYLAVGRPADAARWVADCREAVGPAGPPAEAALVHAAGLLSLASGAPVAARRDLESAVAGWDALDRIWEASWARLDLATALVRSNRFSAAVATAGRVRETAAALDSPALSERAEAIVRHGRSHVVEVEPWHPLTTREFEVARLVSEGRTNAEIAGELGIAPKTASAHIEHILAKLGASRRTEIAAWTRGVAAPSTSAAGA